MKRVLLIVLCLAFAKAELSQAQSIFNRKKAPVNSISGVHNLSLDFMGVKGDVAIYNYTKFDKNGDAILKNHFENEEEAILKKGYFIKKNGRGQVTEKINYAIKNPSKDVYKYDSNGLITKAIYSYGIEVYEYDAKGRVIKNYYTKSGETETFRSDSYSYKNIGNDLEVTIKNDKSGKANVEIYRNGLWFKTIFHTGKTQETSYEFDKYGNVVLVKKIESGKRLKDYRNKIFYYSDFEGDNRLEVKLKKDERADFYLPQTYWDGKEIYLSSTRFKGGNQVVYNPFRNEYYVSIGSYTDLANQKAVKTFPLEFISKGTNVIHYNDLILLDGRPPEGNVTRTKSYLGSLFYFDELNGHFESQLSEEKDGLIPVTYFPNQPLLYSRDREKGQFVFYEKGKAFDYSKITGKEKTVDGDFVIFVNNQPTYVFKNYKNIENFDIGIVANYNGEKIAVGKEANNNIDSFSKDVTAFIKAQQSSYKSRESKAMLKAMKQSLTDQNLSAAQKNQHYINLFNELYDHDKEMSFKFMMLVESAKAQMVLKTIPTERKTFIRTRAKKELKSYEGAHSNVKQ